MSLGALFNSKLINISVLVCLQLAAGYHERICKTLKVLAIEYKQLL
jgi:hypothetical protein